VTSYQVYRAPGSGAFSGTVGPSGGGYLDTAVEPGERYCYDATATNIVGEGPPSAIACNVLPGDVLVDWRSVPLGDAVGLPPVDLPSTPEARPIVLLPDDIPIGEVTGTNKLDGTYCVDVALSGQPSINLACLKVPIAVSDVGVPIKVSRQATPGVPGQPPTPAGSLGSSPKITADLKIRYYDEPTRFYGPESVLGGTARAWAPIGPSDATWLEENGDAVRLEIWVTTYEDGTPAGAPMLVLIPVLGQALGALHASSIGGEELLPSGPLAMPTVQ
jgi:hypothetical protein